MDFLHIYSWCLSNGVHDSCWNMDKHSEQNLHYANFVSKRYLVLVCQLKSIKTQREQKQLYVEATGKVCKYISTEIVCLKFLFKRLSDFYKNCTVMSNRRTTEVRFVPPVSVKFFASSVNCLCFYH